MALFPEPYKIVHIARRFDPDNPDPDTGNPAVLNLSPVIRRVQSIGQTGSTTEQEEGGSVLRVVDALTIAISNPEIYSPGDQVVIDPMLDDDGNWIAGTGDAYRIEGTSNDSRTGPWPRLLRVFGGTINVRRVT